MFLRMFLGYKLHDQKQLSVVQYISTDNERLRKILFFFLTDTTLTLLPVLQKRVLEIFQVGKGET